MHFGPAHTTGDTAVIFRGHKAVHLGDVYNNAGYPFVDADNGGSLSGVIEFCRRCCGDRLELAVVPGHGPVADQELVDYVAMLTTIRDRMTALIAAAPRSSRRGGAADVGMGRAEGHPANFLNRAT